MKNQQHINWVNAVFLTLVPLFAIIGTALLAIFSSIPWQTWVLAVGFAIAMGLSITAGYHRLFAHRSYRAHWSVRLLFALFGAGAFEGSVLEWSTDHRDHHRYTDTDKDPYNINRGFWYAHIGWLITLDQSKRDFKNVEELTADPIVQWQHSYYVPIAVIMGFLLPMLLAASWGDMWGGLIIAGALRATINHHSTFFINSICHLWGTRPYSDRQSARDNWLTALLTFGEGYHNFHHQFPLDYRNGIRFYDYDPTKWLIKLLSWLGLTRDLKKVSDQHIVRYKLQMDEQLLLGRWQHQTEMMKHYVSQKLKPMREAIMQLLPQIEQLEKDYQAMKKAQLNSMWDKVDNYKQRLDHQRELIKNARRELRKSLAAWAELVEKNFQNWPAQRA